MYTKYLTQHITIDYKYSSEPNSTPNLHTTSLGTILGVLPPLIMKKTASTCYAQFQRPFQYYIELRNPSDCPMCIYFFDHLPPGTKYKPRSFVINRTYVMPPTYFNDWVYLGVLPPHTRYMLSYTAKVVPELCPSKVTSQAEAAYRFLLPDPLMQYDWFYAKSNLCRI